MGTLMRLLQALCIHSRLFHEAMAISSPKLDLLGLGNGCGHVGGVMSHALDWVWQHVGSREERILMIQCLMRD